MQQHECARREAEAGAGITVYLVQAQRGIMTAREDMDRLKRNVDALVSLMEAWANWQKGYRMKLGYPSRSCGLSSGASTSFEDMCDATDNETMRIVDGVVQEDLTPIERAAILRRYGVAAVFRFPRDNYEQVLMQAHERLMVLLPRKGCIVL